jgi:hypothetical protein
MPPRPLDPSSVFRRLFAVYGAQFTLIVPAALLVFIPVAAINALVQPDDLGLRFLSLVVSAVATYWLQGMVVEAVRDIQDGRRDFSIGALFRSVTPVLGSLILAGILASIATTIGLFLLLVPGLILLTWWAVIAPVIVIERRPALEAFGRSRELVRGNGWTVFAIVVVVFLLQGLASILLSAALSGADSQVGAALAALISGALIAPLAAIVAALVYLDLSEGRRGDPAVPAAADAA